MAWPRALVYVVTAVLLAIVYFTATPTPRHAPAADPAAAASPEVPHMAIDTVRVEADGRTVGARRARDQWQVVDPPGATVPSDLIEALVSAVLDTPAVPVASEARSMSALPAARCRKRRCSNNCDRATPSRRLNHSRSHCNEHGAGDETTLVPRATAWLL